jgi:hypothetical protein
MAVIEWTGAHWTAPAGDAVWQPGEQRTIDDADAVAGYLALPGYQEAAPAKKSRTSAQPAETPQEAPAQDVSAPPDSTEATDTAQTETTQEGGAG